MPCTGLRLSWQRWAGWPATRCALCVLPMQRLASQGLAGPPFWPAHTCNNPVYLGCLLPRLPLQERWTLQQIPPDTPEYHGYMSDDPKVFADYVAAAFLDHSHLGTFDFVSIDGRARVACFKCALQLLKPHGGVLVLDNSERRRYAVGMEQVPSHWLRKDFVNSFRLRKFPRQRTTVWVSCHKGRC